MTEDVKNPPQNEAGSSHALNAAPKPSRWAAVWLVLAMLVMVGLYLNEYFAGAGEDVEDPRTAAEWVRRAAVREAEGDLRAAELACRAALAREPWYPAAARRLTAILLQQGDGKALYDWMDDLVLGDARQAERYFDHPGFAPWLEDESFRALQREAVIQAND